MEQKFGNVIRLRAKLTKINFCCIFGCPELGRLTVVEGIMARKFARFLDKNEGLIWGLLFFQACLLSISYENGGHLFFVFICLCLRGVLAWFVGDRQKARYLKNRPLWHLLRYRYSEDQMEDFVTGKQSLPGVFGRAADVEIEARDDWRNSLAYRLSISAVLLSLLVLSNALVFDFSGYGLKILNPERNEVQDVTVVGFAGWDKNVVDTTPLTRNRIFDYATSDKQFYRIQYRIELGVLPETFVQYAMQHGVPNLFGGKYSTLVSLFSHESEDLNALIKAELQKHPECTISSFRENISVGVLNFLRERGLQLRSSLDLSVTSVMMSE